MCLFVLCLTVLVNCLLNMFAICVGEVTVFSLNVIVLFLGCVGVLLANPCIVFQRVCSVCDCRVCQGCPPYVRILCLHEGCDFRV